MKTRSDVGVCDFHRSTILSPQPQWDIDQNLDEGGGLAQHSAGGLGGPRGPNLVEHRRISIYTVRMLSAGPRVLTLDTLVLAAYRSVLGGNSVYRALCMTA